MRIAGRIPKATNAHSEYIILIDFPRQQWLGDRALLLHYTLSVLPKVSYSSANEVHTVEKNPFGGLFILNLSTSALYVWLLQRQACRLQRNSSPPPPPATRRFCSCES